MNRTILTFGVLLLLVVSNPITTIKKLPTTKLKINNASFTVELARSPKEQQTGLSGRNSLGEKEGMLFVFERPGYHAFWMHGMKIPLDMIFIYKNKVVSIYQNLPPPASSTDTNLTLYGSGVISDLVLEVKAGTSKKYNIENGDTVHVNL